MANTEETAPVTLSTLRPPKGSTRPRKRVGRGVGSGTGKTAGRGHKGHKARSGGATNPGFEGGQMPIYRRLPKRGFKNLNRVASQAVNVAQLKRLPETDVTPASLYQAGLIGKKAVPVKVLGMGDVDRAYQVSGVALSASARSKIEAAGGKVEA